MKNPYLSLWLSAANTMAGPARGLWSAEMQRQQAAIVKLWIETSMRVAEALIWSPWAKR
ncbi:MAG TPA: hypothetical protein VEH84_08785 [Alphaproteobacteria bacterium]|nr:hypothetical protein [Alphaproteobacteria bacterium]